MSGWKSKQPGAPGAGCGHGGRAIPRLSSRGAPAANERGRAIAGSAAPTLRVRARSPGLPTGFARSACGRSIPRSPSRCCKRWTPAGPDVVQGDKPRGANEVYWLGAFVLRFDSLRLFVPRSGTSRNILKNDINNRDDRPNTASRSHDIDLTPRKEGILRLKPLPRQCLRERAWLRENRVRLLSENCHKPGVPMKRSNLPLFGGAQRSAEK